MVNDFDIIVVGAGISGCTIAERYASLTGKKVLVIDKRDHLGGNCYDFYNQAGILIPLYGPHFFHTNDDEVWRYVSKFTEWFKYEHRVLAYVDGKLIPVPVNINTVNILFKENIKTDKEMVEWLKKETINFKNPKNSEQVALSRVGRRLYEKIFKNYTLKQWKRHPKMLHPEVLARIPVRTNFDDRYFTDKYQVMPKYGYTKLFKRMLNHRKIKVILNLSWEKIKNQINNKKQKIFFTGRIDQFFNHIEGRLEYRSLRFEYQTLNLKYFQMRAVINYPEKKYPFTRITEPKHATGQKHPQTTIIYEYPQSKGEPYYPLPDDKNKKLYMKYQKLTKRMEKDNFYFLGRLANYKYFNMDQAFKNALDFFKKIEKINK